MSTFALSPNPTFADFNLRGSLEKAVAASGFIDPRPIQIQTIPAALAGRDILGLAQTGTGKTAAFALPLLHRLLEDRKPGPRALVLAPTRELAAQIESEIVRLGKFSKIRVVSIFGGVSDRPQISALRRKPDVIVACPGRLLDLMGQKAVSFESIQTLVVDEADHMFDMGFLPDIRKILDALPAQRQNLLFSATMPREIRRLANKILVEPHTVDLGSSAPASTIEHALFPVRDADKKHAVRHFLAEPDFVSAIIFTRTKHRAKKLALMLDRAGYAAEALQGNMSQAARDRAMNGFREGAFEILVATDIAARGIDVAQVSHVINYDAPRTADAYTHRIGRTGRSEREGKAFTLVTDDDHKLIRDVEKRLGSEIPRRTVSVTAPPALDRPRAVKRKADTTKNTDRAKSGRSDSRSGRTRRADGKPSRLKSVKPRTERDATHRKTAKRRAEQDETRPKTTRRRAERNEARPQSTHRRAGLDETRPKTAKPREEQDGARRMTKRRPKKDETRPRSAKRRAEQGETHHSAANRHPEKAGKRTKTTKRRPSSDRASAMRATREQDVELALARNAESVKSKSARGKARPDFESKAERRSNRFQSKRYGSKGKPTSRRFGPAKHAADHESEFSYGWWADGIDKKKRKAKKKRSQADDGSKDKALGKAKSKDSAGSEDRASVKPKRGATPKTASKKRSSAKPKKKRATTHAKSKHTGSSKPRSGAKTASKKRRVRSKSKPSPRS